MGRSRVVTDGLAIWPRLPASARCTGARWLRLALGVGSLGTIVFALGCSDGPAGGAPPRPQLLNTDATVAYVGEDACRPCHLQQASTYSETGMGRSFYPMSPEVAVEDFAVHNEFVDPTVGLHYRMEERAGRFFQRQFLVDSQGREIFSDEYELLWVVGSNNHSRSYVVARGDRWFQAPVCWYPADERWDYCPGYELENDHFNREISLNCLQCHNGRMTPLEGVRNAFSDPVPHGIGCERCHGPGALHVARWKDSRETPTGEPDPTIVQPRRLPREERLSVCFQCHLGDARATERVGRPGRDLQDWRPGQPLGKVIVAFHYTEPTRHDFGLSAQADRMILSRCYTESGGKLECLTCHDPHVSVYHAERPPDYFNQRCVGCHGPDGCAASKTMRLETEPPDDCVACHMRKAEADDQRFAEFTDHWIRRRIDDSEKADRTNETIEPVDPQQFSAFPEAEQAFYVGRASSLMAMNLQGDAQRQKWTEAERAFETAIDDGYATVESWFFLGKARLRLGRTKQALEALRRAHELDPTHHDAAFALGQTLVSLGDTAGAVEVFQAMLSLEPRDPMALAELGRAYTVLGRLDDALDAYERAIESEAWNASLHLNRGMILAAKGRFEEAEAEARAAVRLDPNDPATWELFEKLMRATGRPGEADEARAFRERVAAATPTLATPGMTRTGS